jgi:hypothetical protein
VRRSADQEAKLGWRVAAALAAFKPDEHELCVLSIEADDLAYTLVRNADRIAGSELRDDGIGELWIPTGRIQGRFSSSAADRSTDRMCCQECAPGTIRTISPERGTFCLSTCPF